MKKNVMRIEYFFYRVKHATYYCRLKDGSVALVFKDDKGLFFKNFNGKHYFSKKEIEKFNKYLKYKKRN